MSTLSLLHMDGRWLAFDGDRVRQMDTRPRLDRAALVVTDFDAAISQVIALEGSPSHAVALIEKRLRADGMVDGESKVLIHQSRTVGNGYQALFTAVPLDRWQQLFAWAEGHGDHCLMVPSIALLWRMLRPGRGIVLHSGRQFTFLANLRNRIVHASALAYSESDNDLAMTVASLAERAGRELDGAEEALEALSVEWYGTLTRAPRQAAAGPRAVAGTTGGAYDDESPTQRTIRREPGDAGDAPDAGDMTYDGQFEVDPDTLPDGARAIAEVPAPQPQHHGGIAEGRWTDEALLEIFSEHSGIQARLGPHTMVHDEEGVLYRSGVNRLMANASPLAAVNPPASRLVYLAERVLPWASAASLLLALALAALGGRWALAANEAHRRGAALDDQIAQVEAEIAGLQEHQAMPGSYAALLKFIERAAGLEAALDPTAALHDLRAAAADDVRILRLRLDPGDPGTPASLRVDGMVNHGIGRELEGMQVARFVERLRAAGYVPEAVDPQLGTGRSQSPGGSFSYQLRRAGARPAEDAS